MHGLLCSAQPYEWGKRGSASMVAKLMQGNDSSFVLEEQRCFAELWMGTHPSGPSRIITPAQTMPLQEYIKENPSVLGAPVEGYASSTLPYLLKVLSIEKALSIQSHPDRELAARLYTERPDIYKDPNHKPELAIALTQFEAMCGFRPIEEVRMNIERYPEFRAMIGQSAETIHQPQVEDSELMREIFVSFMNCENDVALTQVQALINRLKSLDEGSITYLEKLTLRLADQFPGDRGCMCVFFLNVVTLEAGQALFMGPNEPHSYISGDIVECMAPSDNVVRVALTPKYKDKDTLCSMLTYRSAPPTVLEGEIVDGVIRRYTAPCLEFELDVFTIPAQLPSLSLPRYASAAIVCVYEGAAVFHGPAEPVHAQQGTVLFVDADTVVSVHTEETAVSFVVAHTSGCARSS